QAPPNSPAEFDTSSCGTSLCIHERAAIRKYAGWKICPHPTKGRASSHQLTHRARGLLDRQLRVGVPPSVGVGDGDASGLLPGALENGVVVVLVVERVRHITVAMRPAVDGDRCDIARARKSTRPEHAIEFVADTRLEIRKRHVEQLRLPDAKLRARVEPAVGRAWNANEMEANRFGGGAGVTIAAETDGKIELLAAGKRHRRGGVVHARPRPRAPPARAPAGVGARRLDVARERLALRRR